MEALERALKYEDIVLYRSLGDALVAKHLRATTKGGSWLSNLLQVVSGKQQVCVEFASFSNFSFFFFLSTKTSAAQAATGLSAAQWKELYDAIDYSESAVQVEADLPREVSGFFFSPFLLTKIIVHQATNSRNS